MSDALRRALSDMLLYFDKPQRGEWMNDDAWREAIAVCERARAALAASDAKRQGLDPQALLGHSSERMTEKYLRDWDVRVVRGPTGAKG